MPVVVKAPTDEVPNVEEVKRAAAKVGRAFGNRDKYNRAHAQLVAVLEKQDPAHLRFWAQVPILDMRWSGATGQGGYWAVATQAVNDVSADLMRQRGREWREKHGADFVVVQETPPARTEQQTTLGNDFATNRNLGFNLESKDFGDEPDALVDVSPPPDPRQTALPAIPTAPSAAPLELVKDSADLMLDIQAEYAIHTVPITSVTVRPDLFQARDTDDPGSATGAERVRQIVENWNPDRFDPLAVVKDAETGNYVVIGGHHRLEAAQQKGNATVPVRVLSGDLHDPADRERLIREAIVSNYTTAAPNIRENVTAAKRLADTGLDTRAIAREMRVARPSQIEDLLWIEKTGPAIIDQIADHGDLIPVAAELGRAVEVYEYSPEAVGGLFSKYRQEFVESGKTPSRFALRLTFQAAERAKAEAQTEQGGMFGGFEDDTSLSALQSLTAEIDAARAENRSLRRNLNACKVLSERLNVPVEAIEAAASRQLAGQDSRLEKLR